MGQGGTGQAGKTHRGLGPGIAIIVRGITIWDEQLDFPGLGEILRMEEPRSSALSPGNLKKSEVEFGLC